ncbi:hypothetical protein FHR32_008726 [Streptosporangium album]|uniref:Transcriptional regulator n=2 Tax=Streptosporangium album TaxID=47479 RepID=A0A7W7S5M0_9ACTN|nr:hypothetical protein [Streptosporangium album]
MGHPTLLALLAAQRHWTSADAVAAFGEVAQSMGSTYIVSERQWERWCAAKVKGLPRPLCCRILENLFERPVRDLFAPPPLMTPLPPRGAPTEGDRAYWREPYESGPHAGSAVIDEEIVTVADDSAQFTRRIRRVDERALDQFDADVSQLAVDYLRRPPYFAFRRVAELRNEVFAVLDSRHPLDQERRLYLVAGKLCALLAHISADLDHPHEAETHVRTALVCAELVEDDSLRSYARWVQSNVAYWRGDYRRAADIARTAREAATTGSDLLRLVSQETRAIAAMRDRSAFAQVVATAIDVRENAEPTDEPGVFRFSPGKAAYYVSEAYHAMGSPADLQLAQQQARESVHLLSADPDDQGPSLLAAATLDLVAAQLTAGELDGAAESLRGVLDTRPELRTVPVVQRVRRIDQQLALTKGTSLILDLREQTALFIAHPAATPEIPGR